MSNTKLMYTLKEFIELVGIGRSTLYVLIKKGEGPRICKFGKRGIGISHQAALDWIKEMENKI